MLKDNLNKCFGYDSVEECGICSTSSASTCVHPSLFVCRRPRTSSSCWRCWRSWVWRAAVPSWWTTRQRRRVSVATRVCQHRWVKARTRICHVACTYLWHGDTRTGRLGVAGLLWLSQWFHSSCSWLPVNVLSVVVTLSRCRPTVSA